LREKEEIKEKVMAIYTISYLGKPGGRETITPGDTATGITSTVRCPTTGTYAGQDARNALIQNKGEYAAHFTIDGTAPTAAAGTNVGFKLAAGNSFIIEGVDQVKNFKVIDAVSGSASIIEVQVFF